MRGFGGFGQGGLSGFGGTGCTFGMAKDKQDAGFGTAAKPTGGFGSFSNFSQSGTFGTPNQSSTFGAPNALSGFGAPNAGGFGASNTQPGGFGTPNNQSSTFGSTASTFGSASTWGSQKNNAQSTGFGQSKSAFSGFGGANNAATNNWSQNFQGFGQNTKQGANNNSVNSISKKYTDQDLEYEIYPMKSSIISGLTWSGDGAHIVISTWAGSVDIYKVDRQRKGGFLGEGETVRTVHVKGFNLAPVLSCDWVKDNVFVVGDARGEIHLIAEAGSTKAIGHQGAIISVKCDRQNSLIISAGTDGFIRKWSSSLSGIAETSIGFTVRAMDVLGDRAVCVGKDNKIYTLDLNNLTVLSSHRLANVHLPISTISIHGPTSTLYAGSNGKLSVVPLTPQGIDVSKNPSTVQAHRVNGQIFSVNDVASCRNGLVLSSGGDGAVNISAKSASGNTFAVKWNLSGLPLPIYKVALDPSESFIALACCEDPMVSILSQSPRISRVFIIQAPPAVQEKVM